MSAEPVKAKVKWFNTTKGFGFVVPETTGVDAFIHISLLEQKGLSSLKEGGEVLCTVEVQEKGHQVTSLLDVMHQEMDKTINDNVAQAQSANVLGTVKWYRENKGYGFIEPEDGGKDIFVHKKCLGPIGLATLEPGQKFDVTFRDVPKGREALSLSHLE